MYLEATNIRTACNKIMKIDSSCFKL